MNRLLASVLAAPLPVKGSIYSWNAAVQEKFGPFVRRKSVLVTSRQLFRTELMNFQRIEGRQEYTKLLLSLVRLYRRGLRKDRRNSLSQIVRLFEGVLDCDRNWVSLCLAWQSKQSSDLHDTVFDCFGLLDDILEGSFRPHLRMLYAFAGRDVGNAFPRGAASASFGALIKGLPPAAQKRYKLLLQDPEHSLPANDWRNIAAHKAFTLKSSRTLEVRYGSPPKTVTKRITIAAVRRAIEWAMKALATLRLATTIVLIEYMPELRSAGLKSPPLRLGSVLIGLCHNLRLIGFACVSHMVDGNTFVLQLMDIEDRAVADAIGHASQVLDQLSEGLESDPALRPRPQKAAVRLVDAVGQPIAQATVDIDIASSFITGDMDHADYLDSIVFTRAQCAKRCPRYRLH